LREKNDNKTHLNGDSIIRWQTSSSNLHET